jgi:hypothetical protein
MPTTFGLAYCHYPDNHHSVARKQFGANRRRILFNHVQIGTTNSTGDDSKSVPTRSEALDAERLLFEGKGRSPPGPMQKQRLSLSVLLN